MATLAAALAERLAQNQHERGKQENTAAIAVHDLEQERGRLGDAFRRF